MYTNEQPFLYEQRIHAEHRWKAELKNIDFSDPRLHQFKEWFLEFYESQEKQEDLTMKDKMDTVLRLAFEQYDEYDAQQIIKAYVLSTVFTQRNERRSRKGADLTFRKHDKDLLGNPFPTIIHPTDMLIEGMMMGPQGVDTVTAMALAAHDIREDCELTVSFTEHDSQQSEKLSGARILDLMREEFPEYGDEMAETVEAVTKYDEIPPEIEQKIRESGIYACLKKLIEDWYRQNGLEAKLDPSQQDNDLAEIDRDIMKSVSSVFKLRHHPLQRYKQGLAELDTLDLPAAEADMQRKELVNTYIQQVVRNFAIKCLDTKNNLQTDVSRASLLRARLLASVARIMRWDISNDIMKLLVKHTNDPLYDGLSHQELAMYLTAENKHAVDEAFESFILNMFGIEVDVSTGFRIIFHDEERTTEADQNQDLSVPQLLVSCPTDRYDEFVRIFKDTSNQEAFQSFFHSEGPVDMRQFEGVLNKMSTEFGDKSTMFGVYRTHQEDNRLVREKCAYVRALEAKPALIEYIEQGRKKEKISPEEKFFTPFADESMEVDAFLNAQLLYFNPDYVVLFNGQKNLYTVVWDNGFTTCDSLAAVKKLCERIGIAQDECDLVDLIREQPLQEQSEASAQFILLKQKQP